MSKTFGKDRVGHLPEVERKKGGERIVEAFTTHAIYEDGKLRPLTPLPCREKEQVFVKGTSKNSVKFATE